MKRFWILVMVLVAGCATTEKKARNYYLEHKDELSRLCIDCFPAKVEYIKGKDVYLPQDTVIIKGDTVFAQGDCPDGTKIKIKYAAKDTMKIYVPILRIDTIRRPDSAAIFYWQSEFRKTDSVKNKLILDKASLNQEKNDWRKWAVIFGAVILLYGGWKVFMFIRTFGLK